MATLTLALLSAASPTAVAAPGKVVGVAETAKGVDVIAYSPQLHHLYVPGEDSAEMTVLDVAADGNDSGGAWVCDPHGGRLLLFRDAQ